MQGLVTSMLEQSRRRPEEPFERVDLRPLVDAAVASASPVIVAGRQKVDVTGATRLMICGDAFRLRQVLDNVLGNAVKYTPAGGRIAVHLEETADGLAEVRVSDTGTGIAPADLERVFEPYFRTERVVRAGIPGTGLGMGIARDIVEAHDGTISITSEQGVGTTVCLRFPRVSSDDREQQEQHG